MEEYKVKSNKGITLVSLIVTIVVMGILLSVTVIYSSDLMQKSKMTDYIGYMKLVKARADVVLEEEVFNSVGEIESDEISNSKIDDIIVEKYNDTKYLIRIWNGNDIANQGIDKSILKNANYFVIVFNKESRKTVDVIYSEGCELKETIYYTLTDMEDVI